MEPPVAVATFLMVRREQYQAQGKKRMDTVVVEPARGAWLASREEVMPTSLAMI